MNLKRIKISTQWISKFKTKNKFKIISKWNIEYELKF